MDFGACTILRCNTATTNLMNSTPTPAKRLLFVTRNLPPLVGGMERLNWHMADQLSRHMQVRVIGPIGSAALAPPGIKVQEIPLRPLWKFLAFAHWHALREAFCWRPDFVLAGSGLTALPAWLAARGSGAVAAVYVHGLDVAVRHPIYRALWLPALRRMDRVIANSTATALLAQQAGVDSMRIGIVFPGVQLPVPFDDMNAVNRIRAEHQLGERPLLLSVGRFSARKGLREFVTQVLPGIVAVHPDVLLLAVGAAPLDALHAEVQTKESIVAAAEQAGIAANLKFLGTITDFTELGAIYRASNVHIFPVREIPGDPEGFGMVAIEAAAHGLPTVAFATGGVGDAVAEGDSGRLISPGDYAAFATAVIDTMILAGKLSTSSRAFAARFAWPVFGQSLVRELAKCSADEEQTK